MSELLVVMFAALLWGLGTGALGVALQLRLRLWRQLDLVPVVGAVAVPLFAASLGGEVRAGPLADGMLLVPAAMAIAFIVMFALGERVRSGTEPIAALTATLLLAFVFDRLIVQRAGVDPRVLGEGSTAVFTFRGEIVLTRASVSAGLIAVLAAALVTLVSRRGRVGRRLQAWDTDPELLELDGLDPGRLGAMVAGVATGLGVVGGLAAAVAAPFGGGAVFPLVGAVGAALMVAGVRSSARVMGVAVALALLGAAVDQVASGWGVVVAYGVALGALNVRLRRTSIEPESVMAL